MSHLPLPTAISGAILAARGRNEITHAGLLLDRFAPYPDAQFTGFDQKHQKEHIDQIAKASHHEERGLLNRWMDLVRGLPGQEKVVVWRQRTVWRLAGQLSRATTVENGSACLHPLYGFAYLPGSGLKGLARAWAHREHEDRVYAPDHDEPANCAAIQRVFGSFDRRRDNEELKADLSGASGSVIFLESWPAAWPKLEADIVNNHHKDYYKNEGRNSPPGDWESPNPTYLLAVAANTPFRFAVAPRDPLDKSDDTTLAAGWLKDALVCLGAGAKTAAGYGYFGKPEEAQR